MEHYDLIVAGTGFASTFFLEAWLAGAPANARVLVLERGPNRTHEGRLERKEVHPDTARTIVNTTRDKPWTFSTWMGGGSRCWAACTPRMLPSDFRTQSLYGRGRDWLYTYDELEPYYTLAEHRMQISGPSDAPWPMSKPYPQPPHTFSDADQLLKDAFPKHFIHQPTARPRLATETRPGCCGNATCHLCPINAKFTVINTMANVYADPRVTLQHGARLRYLETGEGVVKGVNWRQDKRTQKATADRFAIGCNALFNPTILLRSGIDQGPVGKYLVEQRSRSCSIQLDGVEAFRASTFISGLAYNFADGDFRKTRAAAIVETHNTPKLMQQDHGRWLMRWHLKFIFEDLPREDNTVEVDPKTEKPRVTYKGPHNYLKASSKRMKAWVDELVAPLPVKNVAVHSKLAGTEAHIMGTHRMGDDPADSVVDADQIHHRYRNLWVLGGGSFPTCPPANPSLTISAMSIRSGSRAHGS